MDNFHGEAGIVCEVARCVIVIPNLIIGEARKLFPAIVGAGVGGSAGQREGSACSCLSRAFNRLKGESFVALKEGPPCLDGGGVHIEGSLD